MAIPKHIVETPLMKQYYSVKASHPDAVLLFRVGDFYEPLERMPSEPQRFLELP